VAVGEPKLKKIYITNTNPIDIMIASAVKQEPDDLTVYIEKVYFKNKLLRTI
jgi:hypothetical protein